MGIGGNSDWNADTYDLLFRALSHSLRLHILTTLAERAADDTGVQINQMVPPDRDPKAVEIMLRHNHLPMLSENGFIDWDPEAGRVAKGPKFDQIEEILRCLNRTDGEQLFDSP